MTEENTIEPTTETALTLKHAMLSTVFKKTEATRFLELIDEEVMKEVCDPTTTKGQERERSLAAGISSFKAHMNRLALASIEKHAEIVKSTKEYLKEFNANCDARRDGRKAPTLKHEAEEKERKGGHREKIKWMREMTVCGHEPPLVSALEDLIRTLKETDVTTFDEYSQEADIVKHETLETLNIQLKTAELAAEQAAELKRLQEEAEKRKVEDAKRREKEHDRRQEIARVAIVKAQTEQREKDAKDKRLAEEDSALDEIRAITAADNNESLSDILESLEELENFDMAYFAEKAEQAEELRINGIEMLTRLLENAKKAAIEEKKAAEIARIDQERLDNIKAKEEAETARKAAEEAEKQRQIEEDKRIQDAEDQARIDERKRLFDIQSRKDLEAKLVADLAETKRIEEENTELKRQADKDHRAKIIASVQTYLITTLGCTDDQARKFTIDAVDGDIEYVTINF